MVVFAEYGVEHHVDLPLMTMRPEYGTTYPCFLVVPTVIRILDLF